MWGFLALLAIGAVWIAVELFMGRAASEAGPEILSITKAEAGTPSAASDMTTNGQQPTANG